jgi:putative ABC transport system permease protein
LRLVLREGMELVAVGAACGVMLAIAVARPLGRFIYGAGTEPWTYAALTIALATVAFVASWIPARRAARVDPTVSLRAQ